MSLARIIFLTALYREHSEMKKLNEYIPSRDTGLKEPEQF